MEKMEKVDMSFIAEKAGVSRSTVSRVLNSPLKVKEQTRVRVQSILAENNYVYSHSAADFSRKKTSMFALIIPTVQNSIYAHFIEGIHDAIKSSRYDLAIGYTDYNLEEEVEYLKVFRERRMAGIIILGVKDKTKDLIYSIISQDEMEIISSWEYSPEFPISCVGFDNYEASKKMMNYLISLGHKKIGLITGPMDAARRVIRRHQGYVDSLEKAGIAYNPDYVIHTHPSLTDGREAAFRLMRLDDPPTAIFAASDSLAIGVLKAIRDLGLSVPEDVSVAGFDNIDLASYCYPALTTVMVPAYEMGQKAAQQLISQVEDPKCELRKYCLDTELIIRDSCMACQSKSGK
jgi:DNA-binding LacI/PurR family transcriptional regulator